MGAAAARRRRGGATTRATGMMIGAMTHTGIVMMIDDAIVIMTGDETRTGDETSVATMAGVPAEKMIVGKDQRVIVVNVNK